MKNKVLALDSNIFIYHFEANPLFTQYTTFIFNSIVNKSNTASTSIISLIETLSYPSPQIILDQIEESFRTLPNFTIYNINQEIALQTARIRRAYKFRLPDSVQLATALTTKADIFITNDLKLQSFNEIKIVQLEKVTKI